MKKRILLLVIALALTVLLIPRLFVLSLAVWEYKNTNENCPPSGSIPHLPLYEVKPYIVMTGKGYMFPGDEYDVPGEGTWYGMATLLWAGIDGATFLVEYPSPGGNVVLSCRWYKPVGDYR
jgi:hypothetical protein